MCYLGLNQSLWGVTVAVIIANHCVYVYCVCRSVAVRNCVVPHACKANMLCLSVLYLMCKADTIVVCVTLYAVSYCHIHPTRTTQAPKTLSPAFSGLAREVEDVEGTH